MPGGLASGRLLWLLSESTLVATLVATATARTITPRIASQRNICGVAAFSSIFQKPYGKVDYRQSYWSPSPRSRGSNIVGCRGKHVVAAEARGGSTKVYPEGQVSR